MRRREALKAVLLGALASSRAVAVDPAPTQSTSADGNTYTAPIPIDSPFPDNYYGADHAGSSLSLVSPFTGPFGFTDHSRGQFVYTVQPFTPRRSEGVFGFDAWLEEEDGSGNWNPAGANAGVPDQGVYQAVNTPNPGPSANFTLTWTYAGTQLPPNAHFRVFVYVYIYNQGGGNQGDFPIASATAAIDTGPANDPPRISWSPSFGTTNPTVMPAGQRYVISADAQDDNGNLAAVRIDQNGQPFAYAGGGDGASGNSQNPSTDSAGPVTYTAWSVDADGAVSPTLTWTVAISGKANQPPVNSTDAALPFGQAFIPQYLGGAGSGGWQFCVAGYTNWDAGNSAYAGTNLGPSPGNSPGAVWVPSWTPPAAGSYAFYIARDGDSAFDPSGIAGPYTLTVNPPPPPPPQVTLFARPASGPTPLATTLTWTSSQAASVTVAGPGISANSLAGSQGTTLSAAGVYTYVATAVGPGGQAVQSTSVSVAAPQYSLTTSSVGAGSVTPGGTYPAGAFVTVEASPGTGAYFTGWTGGLASSVNPLSVTMTGDLTLYGNFTSMQPQTIFFSPPAAAAWPGPALTLSATASSGLPVNFALLGGPAILLGSQLTPTGAGSISVQAFQSGNSVWLPAVPVTAVIAVNAAPPIARIRFNAAGRDAQANDRSGGSSILWTDPAGLQRSPWPNFANPLAAPVNSANFALPAVPAAGR